MRLSDDSNWSPDVSPVRLYVSLLSGPVLSLSMGSSLPS